mmetsp:Transcript_12324/g.37580  ORF Transcript_12324/g.37580 Transcript_12324/m.37580 type:complete len:342 (-) Transcript_12324:44-1069(-)
MQEANAEVNSKAPNPLSANVIAKFENLWDRRTTVLRFLKEPIVIKLEPSHPLYNTSRRVVVTGPNDLDKIKELGKGAQGVVYLAQHKFSKLPIALKVEGVKSAHDKEQLRAEFRLLSLLQHEHIVKFYGAFYDDKEKLLTLFLEFMDSGCLCSAMTKLGALPEDVLSTVARHCLLGLEYLHSKEVVHRDIKPMNILLSKQRNVATLTDFGMSRKKSLSKEGPDLDGTIEYMAPERLMDENYSYPSDIWSMGVVVAEACLGRHPVPNRSQYWDMCEDKTFRKVCCDMLQENKVSSELLDFVYSCLEYEVELRPTAKDLLDHCFVRRHEDPDATALKQWLSSL